MKKLNSGSCSEVYIQDSIVYKKFINSQIMRRELDFLMKCSNARHIIKMIDYNINTNTIRFPLFSSSKTMDFKLLNCHDRLTVISSLLNGLLELHLHGIIHNDFKIDNVLYDPVNLSVKIIDFSSSYYFDEFTPEVQNLTSLLHRSKKHLCTISDAIKSDYYGFAITVLQLYQANTNEIEKAKKSPRQFDLLIKKLSKQFKEDKKIFKICKHMLFM